MDATMDALLLRSLQGYVRDTFGQPVWLAACRRAALKFSSFEPMLRYDPGMADRMARHVAAELGRTVDVIWEDMGTYLVTNPGYEGVRRLLRFGGPGFVDFLHSLEEAPGRARLAMPGLDLPELSLRDLADDRFEVEFTSPIHGFGRVLVGMLRAMADDYGALCLIEADGENRISVQVLDRSHASGRSFTLAGPEAGA